MLLLPKHINSILLNNIKKSFMIKSCGLMCTKVNKVSDQNNDNKEFIPIFK